MVAFVLAWGTFVLGTAAIFSAVERLRPRHRSRPTTGTIGLAAVLMGTNAVIGTHVGARGASTAIATVVVTWMLVELGHYGVHRTMHAVPALWRFHRHHHAADRPLTWASAWIVHPVDATLFALVTVAATAVVDGNLASSAVVVLGRRLWTVLLHANLAWPATWLDRVIATPPFHARHHDEARPPANFASTLALLDTLAGTADHAAWRSRTPGVARARR